ncbi:MAG: MOSC N-terminal beta barrel domain-containing protein [Caulobacterales bacterium]|nr:MOSC N-terminal beta barrel domain-containing protein [Caulobacterales bacterium]
MSFVVGEIWRYPVKSMRGEQLPQATLTSAGIPLDRGWAVRDEKTQTIRGAKHMPKLMLCSARYLPDTCAGLVPHVEIALPDGTALSSETPQAAEALSDFLGRTVTLWPLMPPDQADHYRIRDERARDPAGEWRRIFMLQPGEAMPSMDGFGPGLLRELSEYAAPVGAYFDAFPINVLTEASLRALQRLVPDAVLDVRRFRPNLLLAGGEAEGFVEEGWIGRALDVGEVGLAIEAKAPRCVMTSHAQAGLDRDPSVIRTIVRELQSCFSAYARVAKAGVVRVGDAAAPAS